MEKVITLFWVPRRLINLISLLMGQVIMLLVGWPNVIYSNPKTILVMYDVYSRIFAKLLMYVFMSLFDLNFINH